MPYNSFYRLFLSLSYSPVSNWSYSLYLPWFSCTLCQLNFVHFVLKNLHGPAWRLESYSEMLLVTHARRVCRREEAALKKTIDEERGQTSQWPTKWTYFSVTNWRLFVGDWSATQRPRPTLIFVKPPANCTCCQRRDATNDFLHNNPTLRRADVGDENQFLVQLLASVRRSTNRSARQPFRPLMDANETNGRQKIQRQTNGTMCQDL